MYRRRNSGFGTQWGNNTSETFPKSVRFVSSKQEERKGDEKKKEKEKKKKKKKGKKTKKKKNAFQTVTAAQKQKNIGSEMKASI